MKIDEYVPTMIPTTSANANPFSTGPPKIHSDNAVSNVRPDVRIVRLSVWLMLVLTSSLNAMRLLQLQVFPNAIEDNDRIIHRVADER